MPYAKHGDTAFSERPSTAEDYRCYPPSCSFQTPLDAGLLTQAWQCSRDHLTPLSLHVHLPFCPHSCHHCQRSKVSTKDHGRSLPYLKYLEQEIALISQQFDPRQHVERLHLGGGTPTFLSHNELRELMRSLRQHFTLLDDDSGDYSIEIDPREADWSTMGLLRELGFNRIIIGVHELAPEVQEAINRPLGMKEVRTIMEAARTLQYRSIGIDLIYGLPQQTLEGFANTLGKVLPLQPGRVSLYRYQHHPEQHANLHNINRAELPAPTQIEQIRQAAFHSLETYGYRHIGLGHFALPDDELSMAQEEGLLSYTLNGYSTHRHCDLVGIGASAISLVQGVYYQNSTDIAGYQQALQNTQRAHLRGLSCNNDDQLRAYVIEQLICYQQLDIQAFEQKFQRQFFEYFQGIQHGLQALADTGHITLDRHFLRLQHSSRETALQCCELFDRYIKPSPPL